MTVWRKSDGRVYRTRDCLVLASSHLEPGNWKCWLLRTPDGLYLDQYQAMWKDPADHMSLLTMDSAMSIYEAFARRYVPWAEAFPGIE